MHKMTLTLSTALLIAPSIATCEEVRLLTWEAYLSEQVIAAFREETGHNIQQIFISSDTERNVMLATGGARQFDLVLSDSVATKAYAQDGLIQPLSELVPNASNIDERWRHACGNYGVAYSWGTMGIAYRSSVIQQVNSWQQLFSPPAAAKKRVVMMADIHDFTAIALIASGHNPNSEKRDELQDAYALMREQKPAVLEYGYGLSYALRQKQDSQMAMTLAYSGDIEEIINATGQQDWVYQLPDEGTMLWVDCWTAPAGQPVKASTRSFLNFINRPDIAALNSETTWMPTPLSGAKTLASKEHRQDQELYPGKEVIEKSSTFRHLSKSAIDLRAKMVAAIRE